MDRHMGRLDNSNVTIDSQQEDVQILTTFNQHSFEQTLSVLTMSLPQLEKQSYFGL